MIASIFTKNKKQVKPAEDPAVVAARKQFLMSSAPDRLRTQISAETGDTDHETGDTVVWPGVYTCPSHVTQLTSHTCRQSVSGSWSLTDPDTADVELRIVESGMLNINKDESEEDVKERSTVRLSEADVLATIEVKSGQDKRMFNSLMERRLEAEMFEKEAREKNLSVAEVEEKRIRGNRRRSRRSLEDRCEGVKYSVESGSGLLWSAKYQPRCGADVLGNQEEVARLRDWLRHWTGHNKTEPGKLLTSFIIKNIPFCIAHRYLKDLFPDHSMF